MLTNVKARNISDVDPRVTMLIKPGAVSQDSGLAQAKHMMLEETMFIQVDTINFL